MRHSKKSDVRCLECNAQFGETDVEILEADGLLPICDFCISEICTVKVKYDGSKDLLEFLKQEIKGHKCAGCLKPALELENIRYGSNVTGLGQCSSCNQGWVLEIHIEFV